MAKNKWRPVKLEGGFLNDNLTDLIGIEELTDYNLDTLESKNTKLIEIETVNKSKRRPSNGNQNLNNNKKLKKKHISNDIPGKFVLNPDNKSKVKTKKKKKKTKVKVKKEVGSTVSTSTEMLYPKDMIAWSDFGLPEELIRALADQGFQEPTQIQRLTLAPAILGRRDILGAAETGSGKTLAFGLPILTGILDLKKRKIDINKLNIKDNNLNELEDNFDSAFENDSEDNTTNLENGESEQEYFEDSPDELEWQDDDEIETLEVSDSGTNFDNKEVRPLYALILTPTRELAVQIKNHLIAVTKYTDIRVAVVLGGMAAVKQERILSKHPEIVVATPGRLWELILEGNSHLSQVDNIRYLAIDETDRMVERGHFQELHSLIDRLNANADRKNLRQNFVFSATLTLVHDLPKHLEKKKKFGRGKSILKLTPGQKLQKLIDMVGMTNPKIVDITLETGTASSLTECRITCPIDDKDYYLYYFLKRHPGRTLVFCNSIGCVKRLTTLFALLQCEPLPLHASMQQRQRLKNLERFRDDPLGVLIATDVAARGLDIPKVQHVIHYQVPRTAENYVHRSGRTARATSEGITVLFMEPTELKSYVKICHTLGKTEDLPLFPVADNMLSAVKQRVNLGRDLDKIELKTRRVNSETGWLQKAINEMDIIVDVPSHIPDDEVVSKQKKTANIKRKQLASLLAKPIFPKGFSFKYPTVNTSIAPVGRSDDDAITVMKTAMENYARSGNNKLGTLRQRMKKNRNTIVREKKIAKQKRKDLKKKQKKKLKEQKENENVSD